MTYIGQQPATTFDAGIQDRFTGLSSNTVTLTHEIAAEEDILVVWNNIVQDKNTYSVGGTGNKTLTLGGTLVSADVVTVYYLNKVMQSVNPTAGSVGTEQLNTDAVTEAKIADDAVESEHLNNNIISGQTELAETPADTDEVLISDAGTLKRIDFSYLKSSNTPYWEVGLSTNQSIPNSTHTTFGLTVLREGTSSTYWDSSNFKTQNLTAGKYYCWMHLSAESDIGASTAYVQIKRFNSSDSEQSAATQAVADLHKENGVFIAGVFNVASGDYIKYTMWQNSGSATTQIYEAGDGSTMAGGGFKLA